MRASNIMDMKTLVQPYVDDEPILAVGQLRQGKAPTVLGLLSGAALGEVLRPRRSKLLPRHFVLAVTPTRVLAFKAWGGGEDGDYEVHIRPGVRAEFARAHVTLGDLADGARSKGGTLRIGPEAFPVCRPNLNGDPETDALVALLGGLQPVVNV